MHLRQLICSDHVNWKFLRYMVIVVYYETLLHYFVSLSL